MLQIIWNYKCSPSHSNCLSAGNETHDTLPIYDRRLLRARFLPAHSSSCVLLTGWGRGWDIFSVHGGGGSGSAWFGAKTDVTCVGAALMHGQVMLLLRR